MTLVLQFLSVLLALGIQVALWPDLINRALPAVILVNALAWGFFRSPGQGFVAAAMGGLVADLYSQTHFGMFTIATTVGYASTLLLRPRDEVPGVGLRFSAAVLAALVYHLVLLIWFAVTTDNFPFFEVAGRVATLDVVVTLLFAILLEIGHLLWPKRPQTYARSI